jgi:hypothetical protein
MSTQRHLPVWLELLMFVAILLLAWHFGLARPRLAIPGRFLKARISLLRDTKATEQSDVFTNFATIRSTS